MALFDLAQLEAAAELVHAVMPPTPQYAWPLLSARAGAVCRASAAAHAQVVWGWGVALAQAIGW